MEATRERHVDFLSQMDWQGLLIGPCLVELWSNSDGTGEVLRFRSLTADLTLRDVSLISPELLAKLFDTAPQGGSNGD
jgi:hypothetical protein